MVMVMGGPGARPIRATAPFGGPACPLGALSGPRRFPAPLPSSPSPLSRLVGHADSAVPPGFVKKHLIFLTGQPLSTKIGNLWPILGFTTKNLIFLQNGIFFATSHGKCACDGLGGTVKRICARRSGR